jgi:hypothetical protein
LSAISLIYNRNNKGQTLEEHHRLNSPFQTDKFADDTSLLYSANNINEIEFIVNSDLSKIYNWSKEWLVDFNPKKAECIIFSTNQAANC